MILETEVLGTLTVTFDWFDRGGGLFPFPFWWPLTGALVLIWDKWVILFCVKELIELLLDLSNYSFISLTVLIVLIRTVWSLGGLISLVLA